MTKKDKYEQESKDKPKISLLFLYDSDKSCIFAKDKRQLNRNKEIRI